MKLAFQSVTYPPVGFNRTKENFLGLVNLKHQGFRRIPCVHQYGRKPQFLMFNDIFQHIMHMFGFSLAVRVGIEDAKINEPKLVLLGIDINASDDPDAFNHRMGIAAPLPPNRRKK